MFIALEICMLRTPVGVPCPTWQVTMTNGCDESRYVVSKACTFGVAVVSQQHKSLLDAVAGRLARNGSFSEATTWHSYWSARARFARKL